MAMGSLICLITSCGALDSAPALHKTTTTCGGHTLAKQTRANRALPQPVWRFQNPHACHRRFGVYSACYCFAAIKRPANGRTYAMQSVFKRMLGLCLFSFV